LTPGMGAASLVAGAECLAWDFADALDAHAPQASALTAMATTVFLIIQSPFVSSCSPRAPRRAQPH
jgi:hypothetical protein